MGLRDNLRAFSERWAEDQKRTLTPAQFWGTGNESLFKGRTAAGETVDLDTALTLPVVQRAFGLMVGDVSTLPVDVFRAVGDRRIPTTKPAWVEDPDPGNPNTRRQQFIGQCVSSLMDDGNLFIRAFPNRFDVSFVRVVEPRKVTIETDRDGIDQYRIGAGYLGSDQIVHVPLLPLAGRSRGPSPIAMLAESIASGLAAMKFGGFFFANGAAMQGVVEVPTGAVVDAKKLKDDLMRDNRGTSKSHAIGVLTGGATFKELTSNPRDSQMVELQEYIVEEVGRAFGIPPYLLGSQKPGAVAYASTSNARVDYVVHAVARFTSAIQDAMSQLVPGKDTFYRFNLPALLRGDPVARYAAYKALLDAGVITKDEVRAWEDWGPADEAVGVGTEHGGYLQTPNNTSPVAPAPAEGSAS